MQLPEPAGLQPDEGGGDGCGDGEVGGVDLVEVAASSRHRLALLLERLVDERAAAPHGRRRGAAAARHGLRRHRRVEDVRVRRRHRVEHARVDAEVLGQHVPRRVLHPVVEVERGAGGGVVRFVQLEKESCADGDLPRPIKITVVKHQEVLVLVGDPLDRVGHTLGEVPDVAVVERVHLVDAVLVDCRDDHLASVDKAPLGLEQVNCGLCGCDIGSKLTLLQRGANEPP